MLGLLEVGVVLDRGLINLDKDRRKLVPCQGYLGSGGVDHRARVMQCLDGNNLASRQALPPLQIPAGLLQLRFAHPYLCL